MEKVETIALGLDLSKVANDNVRNVALQARTEFYRGENDPSYKVQGMYSEAYGGEKA